MTDEIKTGLSRRTLAKGAAWTVPAAAVVAAAPAYAASPKPCTESGLCFGCSTVHKCCSGGRDALYWACVTFTNNGSTDVTVSFSFTVDTSANGSVPISGGGAVPAGQTVTFKPETARQYGNCSTGTYDSFTITFEDGLGGTGSALVPGGSLAGGGNTCPSNTTCSCSGNLVAGAPVGDGEDLTTQSLGSVEEPIAEQSAAEEPAAKQSVTEKPVVEEPTAEEPVLEEPAGEEPAAEEAPGDATPEGEDA